MPDPAVNLLLVAQSKTQITFSWTAGDDGGSPIRDYEIFGDEGNPLIDVADFVQLADSTFLLTQYTELDLTPGTFYRFVVKTRNDAGVGLPSGSITV